MPAPTNKASRPKWLLSPVAPVVGAARHLLWYLRYHSALGDQRANR